MGLTSWCAWYMTVQSPLIPDSGSVPPPGAGSLIAIVTCLSLPLVLWPFEPETLAVWEVLQE